jgi:hypothetical protein
MGKRSSQRWLKIVVMDIFPGQEIREEYLHPNMIFPGSRIKMELDLYIPALSIAFEYQGYQHYHDSFFFGTYKRYVILQCTMPTIQ